MLPTTRLANSLKYYIWAAFLAVSVVVVDTPVAIAQQTGAERDDTFDAHSVDAAELIFINGKIATNKLDNPFAEACVIADGHFIAVGPTEEVLRKRNDATKVIDLMGRTVIPGLNDSHLHAVRGGRFFNSELRWDGVSSLRRGIEMIRQQAERTPKGQWVRVIGGWSPFQFEERRLPTCKELTAASPDTPVFVLFLYSRAFLNQKAVEELGITRDTKAPRGSRCVFVDGGAELHAEPNPTILYKTISGLPSLSPEDQLNSTRHFYRELARFGLTSAVDTGGGGHVFPENYEATRKLAEAGSIPLRVSVYLFPQTPGRELEDFQRWLRVYERQYNWANDRLHGYIMEGGGEYLVWSAGDFENFLAPRPELSPQMREELKQVASLLLKNNWPIRIHATYNESISKILDVFEELDKEIDFSGRRWAIDHAETISEDNIARVKALGGGIAIQNRMAFAGEYFADRYGFRRASSSPPLRKLIESGVPLGAGTDGTRVASYNPWLSLAWMTTGKTVGGAELYAPENRLTRAEALRLYTIGSAWFSGEDGIKGRIAVGQLADLAVLTKDYFTVNEDEIKSIESVLTIVGGDVTYATGDYADLSPEIPPVSPKWSPAAHFGGFQNER